MAGRAGVLDDEERAGFLARHHTLGVGASENAVPGAAGGTVPGVSTTRAERWRAALAGWAIPDHVLAAAPEPPWGLPPSLFARRTAQALEHGANDPSRRRALEALPEGGTVLDVGVGAGAASLPLAPPAGLVVGVDEGAAMLAAFAAAAERLGVGHREVHGAWPGVAAEAGVADVVVCHHVLYNVADLVPFAVELTARARRRVVVELSGEHPTSDLNPLWVALHGIRRPTSPTAEDAVAVLEEMGLGVRWEAFERTWPPLGADRAETVAAVRRRLCLTPDRDDEIDALLPPEAPVRRTVVAWWDGTA